tara:strand:+ start:55 stop:264 length:210 start_codon:yes stop_codon:yes gene_type:complete
MKKVMYYATVDGQQNYDLPKELPIPKKDDILFINGIGLKTEIVVKVNYVGYHLNDLGSLITICVNCTKA